MAGLTLLYKVFVCKKKLNLRKVFIKNILKEKGIGLVIIFELNLLADLHIILRKIIND